MAKSTKKLLLKLQKLTNYSFLHINSLAICLAGLFFIYNQKIRHLPKKWVNYYKNREYP